jgi:hypothetical protein
MNDESEQTQQRLSTADLTSAGRADTQDAEVSRESEGADEEDRNRNEPLLSPDRGEAFQGRWERIQVSFVDQPQESVRDADALVAELMQELATTFADERNRLEGEWARGEQVSTEDLRRALQHYRSFFQRLLSA